jgi:hypothetical protein
VLPTKGTPVSRQALRKLALRKSSLPPANEGGSNLMKREQWNCIDGKLYKRAKHDGWDLVSDFFNA